MTGVDMATLARARSSTDEEFLARDVVKVVTTVAGDALYFSRAPIGSARSWRLRHIGLYAYRTGALRALGDACRPPRWSGQNRSNNCGRCSTALKFAVSQTDKPHLGVDRPEDVAARRERTCETQA